MRKVIVLFLILGICFLGASQLVFAAGNVTAPQGAAVRPCFLDMLSEENRVQVEKIIQEYHDKMIILREKMQSFRVSGDREKLQEVRDEVWEVKEQKREAIAPYIPEDLQEQFAGNEYARKRTFRPEQRSFKHAWNKNESKGGSLGNRIGSKPGAGL